MSEVIEKQIDISEQIVAKTISVIEPVSGTIDYHSEVFWRNSMPTLIDDETYNITRPHVIKSILKRLYGKHEGRELYQMYLEEVEEHDAEQIPPPTKKVDLLMIIPEKDEEDEGNEDYCGDIS